MLVIHLGHFDTSKKVKNACVVNLKEGKVVYDTFNIDFNKSFVDQLFELREDLIQITYDNNYLIDIGWHPELDPNGFLKIQVIKNCDWLHPLFLVKCRTLKDLEKQLNQAITIIKPNEQ